MTSFRYVALTLSGEVNVGRVEATSREEAVAALGDQSLRIVEVDAAARSRLFELLGKEISLGPSVSSAERALIMSELGTMLAAGAPLDAALRIARDISNRKSVKSVIDQLYRQVREGASLSAALGAQPGIFGPNICAAAEAAELNGQLARTLTELGAQLRRAAELQSKIISSLYYPAILLTAALFAIVFVVAVLLPQFEPMFATAGQELPLITRIVRGAGKLLIGYYWLFPLGAALLVATYLHSRRSDAARIARDRFLLTIPVAGRLMLTADMACLARTLAGQLSAGVPIQTGLVVSEKSLGNAHLRAKFRVVRERVKNGERLGAALAAVGVFPDLMRQFVEIGEETGKLDTILIEAADLFETRLRAALERAVAVLTPALTAVMGLIIAAVIFAVLATILGVNQLI